MPQEPTAAGHRLSPADLPPELRDQYAAARARTTADNQLGVHGPPVDPDQTPAAPFYAELHAAVARLKAAREAAGLTVEQVAERAGLAVSAVARLEDGTATNPTWQTLGRYAAAVGCRLTLGVEPAAG